RGKPRKFRNCTLSPRNRRRFALAAILSAGPQLASIPFRLRSNLPAVGRSIRNFPQTSVEPGSFHLYIHGSNITMNVKNNTITCRGKPRKFRNCTLSPRNRRRFALAAILSAGPQLASIPFRLRSNLPAVGRSIRNFPQTSVEPESFHLYIHGSNITMNVKNNTITFIRIICKPILKDNQRFAKCAHYALIWFYPKTRLNPAESLVYDDALLPLRHTMGVGLTRGIAVTPDTAVRSRCLLSSTGLFGLKSFSTVLNNAPAVTINRWAINVENKRPEIKLCFISESFAAVKLEENQSNRNLRYHKLEEPGSISALVLPSDMAARHRKEVTAGQLFFRIFSAKSCTILQVWREITTEMQRSEVASSDGDNWHQIALDATIVGECANVRMVRMVRMVPIGMQAVKACFAMFAIAQPVFYLRHLIRAITSVFMFEEEIRARVIRIDQTSFQQHTENNVELIRAKEQLKLQQPNS
ncbi:hypothetical protein CLF_109877, partial [Clonorchis sinensis]